MQQVVFRSEQHPRFVWIDVSEPTAGELQELAEGYGLDAAAVLACLEPQHFPKHEQLGETALVIARAYDTSSGADADTLQALSNKVAVFAGSEFLLTIHRRRQPFLDALKCSLPPRLNRHEPFAQALVAGILDGALDTFWKPLEDAENAIASFETELFRSKDATALTAALYQLKRKVTAIRWMTRHTLEALKRVKTPSPRLKEVRDQADSLYFAADEILDDVHNLLNVQLALAAHQTNHVVRVLTIFSVFFMPLTFIVGVYGMNFEHMPELKQAWGYPAVMAFMVATSAGVYTWFKRRGWL